MATEENKNAKVTLHWLEKSRSHRILWMLEELQIPYELKTYKRNASDFLAEPALKQIHPLGKSPVITVTPPDLPALTIAESGAIVEYLSEYFGPWLTPKRYPPGQEGKIGGETAAWLRYRHLMHYAEGSIINSLLIGFIVNMIRDAPAPFFIRPITKAIATRINDQFLSKQYATHFSYVEELLGTIPGLEPGEEGFFCGKEPTGADILMVFPLELAVSGRVPAMTKEKYPRIYRYVERCHEREAYKQAIQKVKDETGEFSMEMNPNVK